MTLKAKNRLAARPDEQQSEWLQTIGKKGIV
jgi:hypothetical protein